MGGMDAAGSMMKSGTEAGIRQSGLDVRRGSVPLSAVIDG
jgi:hypothetical protein